MPEKPKVSDLEKAYRGMSMAVVEDLLRYCDVWVPNMANDPVNVGRKEGRRQIGLYILKMRGEINLPQGVL